MRNENITMLNDTLAIFDQGYYTLDGKKINLKLTKEEMQEANQQTEKKTTDSEYTFFWLDNKKNGEFSNWYRRDFVIDDFRYFCVEQYMMSQKAKLFHDSENYTAILRANTPAGCKALGRKVTPFDYKKWNEIKYDVVKTGNRAKFEQNPVLKNRLLQTGNSILGEASPKDTVWGIGLDAEHAGKTDPANWPGQNLLGRILMELRDELS